MNVEFVCSMTKTESPYGALKMAVAGIASTGWACGKTTSARTNIPGRNNWFVFSNVARNATLRVVASKSGLSAVRMPENF